MARFRNDHGEDRVVPTLGYVLVPAGETVTVPDDEWPHWDAAGWTPLDPDPTPVDAPPRVDPILTLPVATAPTPPPAPSTPAVPAPAPAAASLAAAPEEKP